MIIVYFLILFCFAIAENIGIIKKRHNTIFIGLLALIVILESIKFESGVDFYNSYNHYHNFKNDISTKRYEPLYNTIVYFFSTIVKLNYVYFLLIYYGTIYTLYYFSLHRITQRTITALLLLFVLTFGYMGSNRQLMALSIVFFAYTVLLKKNKFVFLLLVLVAFMFHYSAIICLVLLLIDFKINSRYWILLFVSGFALQVSLLNKYLFDKLIELSHFKPFQDRMQAYYELNAPMQSNSYFFYLGIIRRIMPILFIRKLGEIKGFLVEKNQLINTLCISLALYLFFWGNFEFINSRIAIYFVIFEIYVFLWILDYYKNSKFEKIVIFAICSYALVLFLRYLLIEPKHFIPFKTIFFQF